MKNNKYKFRIKKLIKYLIFVIKSCKNNKKLLNLFKKNKIKNSKF